MGAGSLELIVGPMFSGKTDRLIDRFERLSAGQGVDPLAVKPRRDTRSAPELIVSHSNREIPATAIDSPEEILAAAGGARAVLIDEIQFFDLGLTDAVLRLRERGIDVVAAGLDLDFRREPFETTASLMPSATSVKQLQAVCTRCGRPAAFTQRSVDGRPAGFDAPRLLVGDAEIYEPRCARCWLEERSGTSA